MSEPENNSSPSPETSSLPIESHDDRLLRALAGASFPPDARVTLPSGAVVSGHEVETFSAALASGEQSNGRLERLDDTSTQGPELPRVEPNEPTDRSEPGSDPLASENDRWTGDPAVDRNNLVVRAIAALHQK